MMKKLGSWRGKRINFVTWAMLLAAATGTIRLQAITIYSTQYNHFAGIGLSPLSSIENGCLVAACNSTAPLVMLDTVGIAAREYRYYARIANLHSKEGKSYRVIDGEGQAQRVDAPQCGIVFNAASEDDYWAVTMTCRNTNPLNDIIDRRVMSVTLAHVRMGCEQVVKTVEVNDDVDLLTGFNVICVDVKENAVYVSVGSKVLKPLFHADAHRPRGMVRAGVLAGPGSEIKLERAVLSFSSNDQTCEMTAWTRSKLDAHFTQSKNPYEGYWTYLDRDLEDKWLRLGGRYTVALVETETGYDLIYIEGAQVKKSQWETGMLKGRLTKTIFTDNFSGMWVDATYRPFSEDVYATFESGVILNIKFPVYRSQIRFSKVLDK